MQGWVLRLGLATMGVLVAAPLACTPAGDVFTCASDSDCTGDGAGTCQSTGFCAFPDAMCESGSRYGGLAGGGFADTCVPPDHQSGTDATTDLGDSSTATTPGTTSSPPRTTMSTTGPTSLDTSTETGETSGSQLTSGPQTGDSTGSATCELLFLDEFEGALLSPGWEVVGPGQAQLVDGTLEITPTPIADDSPTWVRRATPVNFDEMWFRMQIENLPSDEGFLAILSVSRDDDTESFDITVSDDSEQILARISTPGSSRVLQAMPYDKFDTPWIGLREADGRLYFERGEDPDMLVPFLDIESDVSDWDATLSVGADNLIVMLSSDEANIEAAAACAFP